LSWWTLALGVLAVLVILALVETVWLPKSMPREYVARTSLLLLPSIDAPDIRGWSQAVPRIAEEAKAARRFAGGAARIEASTEDATSQPEQAPSLRVNMQCIQVADSTAPPVQGMLVSATVRGGDEAALGALADEWTESFAEGLAASYPFLTVQSTEVSQVRYQPCTGR